MQSYSTFKYGRNISKQFMLAASRSSFDTRTVHSWRPEHHLSSSWITSFLHPINSSFFLIHFPTSIRPYSAVVMKIMLSLGHDICRSSEAHTSIVSINENKSQMYLRLSRGYATYSISSRQNTDLNFYYYLKYKLRKHYHTRTCVCLCVNRWVRE